MHTRHPQVGSSSLYPNFGVLRASHDNEKSSSSVRGGCGSARGDGSCDRVTALRARGDATFRLHLPQLPRPVVDIRDPSLLVGGDVVRCQRETRVFSVVSARLRGYG